MNAPLTPEMEAAGLTPGAAPIAVLLPDPTQVFAQRARRLRELAPGHSLEAWLLFVAGLSEAQQQVTDALAGTPVPSLADCLHDSWRGILQQLLASPALVAPATAQAEMKRLAGATEAELNTLAEAVLGLSFSEAQLASLPFVAAALQVYWTRLAASLDPAALTRPAAGDLCPVCGSHPVASSIVAAGETVGMRYLDCSLCHTRWHHIRAKCTVCEGDQPVEYQVIEDSDGSVRAETCEQCHSYLKVLFPGKVTGLESTADDLASLGLDLLLDESGYQRAGVNLFMVGLG